MPNKIIRFDPDFEVEVSNIVTFRYGEEVFTLYQKEWQELMDFVSKNLEPPRKRNKHQQPQLPIDPEASR